MRDKYFRLDNIDKSYKPKSFRKYKKESSVDDTLNKTEIESPIKTYILAHNFSKNSDFAKSFIYILRRAFLGVPYQNISHETNQLDDMYTFSYWSIKYKIEKAQKYYGVDNIKDLYNIITSLENTKSL